MRSTGSEYDMAGGFLRVEKLVKPRKKTKKEERIHDEKWRLASKDIPAVIVGNGGRTDVIQMRTDLCNYVDSLG